MSPLILVLRPEADFKRVNALPPKSLNVTYRTPDDPELPALMKQAAALVMPAMGPKLPPSLFEETTIKLAQITGAGVDRLDEPTLKRLRIPVANVPGGSNSAVAEYAVTASATLLRRFAWSDAEIKAGHYERFRARMLADNLGGIEGTTVGIVGFGVIGVAVAEAFRRAGAKIAYYDPAPRDPRVAAALDARALSLEELLRTCDVITLHVPLLSSTKGLIGEKELALMKRGAVLVNAARGGIVDEAALARSLESGHLGGAAVDVYSVEPPPPDNPLLALKGEGAARLLLTPHIAGVTRQSFAFLFRSSWENVERVLRGEAPLYRVY